MSDRKQKPRAPMGLGPRGLKFWHEVNEQYVLRSDELRVLEDACREMAIIDEMNKELSRVGVWMEGAAGQQRMNPLVAELRQHRMVLLSALRQLKLPDGEDGRGRVETPEEISAKARRAAHSRWSRVYGASA